MNTGELG